jgi:transcriptional regulator with XRE-family HTH domain
MENMNGADEEFLGLVGNHIRENRKALGMSQERLAELASIHPTYVSAMESGKANASICVLRRVAAALRVPLLQLLDVNMRRIEPDALMKTFIEIKALPTKEQRMFLQTIKGLLSGIKG